MVTVQEFGRQIQQRRQTLTSAQKTAEGFDPRVAQTQAQLRRATPLSQARVRGVEKQRAEAKQVALQKVSAEFGKQRSIEGRFAPIAQKQAEQKSALHDFQQAKMAVSKDLPAGLENKRQRKFYSQLKRGGSQAGPTATESSLGMSLPKDLRDLTPSEITGGTSLPTSIRQLSAAEISAGTSFQPELQSLAGASDLTFAAPELPSAVATLPSIGERLRGTFRRKTGISLPGKQQFKETFGSEAIKELPSRIPAGASLFLESAGVPTVTKTKTFQIPERRFLESGTGILEDGSVSIPEPFALPGTPTETVTTTIISPRKLGAISTLPVYAVPVVGLGLVGASVAKNVGVFRQPVPTVSQAIIKQTPDLSVGERTAYLKTAEGKKFQKGVEDYVGSLKRQKTVALGGIALGGAAIVAPFAIRGVRAGSKFFREPVIVKGPRPKTVSYYEAVVVPGKKAEGVAVIGDVTLAGKGTAQTGFEKWLGRKPRDITISKPTMEIGIVPFQITKGVKAGRVFRRKVGPTTTRTTQDLIIGRDLGAPLVIGEMKPLAQFIAKKLPPRAVGPGVKMTTEAGRVLRIGSTSKAQTNIFIPKTPVSLKTAPMQLGVSRSVRVPAPGKIGVFAVETAVKTTKSAKPIMAGRVDMVTGKVMVLPPRPTPGATGTIISTKGLTRKQILKQKQLTEQIGGFVALARAPPKKFPTTTPKAVQEPFVNFPRAVGGLGRGVSPYYGRPGTPELDVETVRAITLPGVNGQSLGTFESPAITQSSLQTPLVFTKQNEKIDFLTAGRTDVLQPLDIRQEVELIPRTRVAPSILQAPAQKAPQRLAQVPALATKTGQVQVPRATTTIPRPTPTITPRPPRRGPPPRRPVTLIPRPRDTRKPTKIRRPRPRPERVTPFVRRSGKFFAVGRPTTKEKAIKRGVSKLRGTLAASLQLRRPSGELISFARETKEFRIGRGGAGTLVQRQRKRLGRVGETREIVATRRTGVKFI